jgi:hypothetical protein
MKRTLKLLLNSLVSIRMRKIVTRESSPFSSFNAELPDVSLRFDKRMIQLSHVHAFVLGCWALLNVAMGAILTFLTYGNVWTLAFYTMNLSWGVINGGAAAFVYAHTKKSAAKPKTLLRRLDLQRHVEKVLLFNAGLDIAFIVGGWALYQRASITDVVYPDLWKGFGTSVLMQGAYLLIQDSIFYYLHLVNSKQAYPVWKREMQH